MKPEYAEDIKHYWKTSSSSPDSWMIKARRQIEKLGGKVLAEGHGSQLGQEAYMLGFEIEGERYKVVWPVLPSKSDDQIAARRQATTMLYHDIKAKTISAAVLGVKAAFFSYLLLPDGRATLELATPELTDAFPKMLGG